jgi:acetyl esterase/lipase
MESDTTSTFIYKTVGRCELHLDVHTTPGHPPMPAVLWIHGGGMILGSRRMLPAGQAQRYLEAGFAIIAVDYRLAPESNLRSILADLEDAYSWIQNHGKLMGIDPDRIALVGHSAGGYLAIFGGTYLTPTPKAIVSLYGYGDISAEWALEPNQPYRESGLIPAETARQNIGTEIISQSSVEARLPYYLYCRQTGTWVREILGSEFDSDLRTYCPIHAITPDYPPTLLLHGDQDIDVPVSETFHLAEQLSRSGVPHRKIILPGYGHGFDGLQDPCVAQALAEVIQFLKHNC